MKPLFHPQNVVKISVILLASTSFLLFAQESAPKISSVQNHQGRKVTITKLSTEEGQTYRKERKQITLAKKQAKATEMQQRLQENGTAAPTMHKSFIVSASIMEDQTSLLVCRDTSGGESISVQSNINWSHFTGQQIFQDGDVQYAFILLPVNASQVQQDAHNASTQKLPTLRASGAQYIVTQGNAEENIVNFLEAVHQRYDQEKGALIRNYQKAQRDARERVHQLKANPPKAKDVNIRFWRRTSSAKSAKTTSNSNGQ